MLRKTNLVERLSHLRHKRISVQVDRVSEVLIEEAILSDVRRIFSENEEERGEIRNRLNGDDPGVDNPFDIDLLASENIFHKNEIKRLCVDYRLRFLDARYFKGAIPEEAVSKIRRLEKEHDITMKNLKIVAPAKLLKLENADDPLLFAPIGNDYFYLIHKWGNDLNAFRKLLMWPYKTFENLVFTIFLVSLALTAITPMQAFTQGEVGNQEYLLLFLFMFKAVGGTVLFYGFAKGKNFNSAIWDSKYYNG